MYLHRVNVVSHTNTTNNNNNNNNTSINNINNINSSSSYNNNNNNNNIEYENAKLLKIHIITDKKIKEEDNGRERQKEEKREEEEEEEEEIPKVKIVRVSPEGYCCMAGLYNAYDTSYPPELINHISSSDYTKIMEELNECLSTMWPCCLCHVFGYLFCICTAGISLLFPMMCVTHAKFCSQNLLKTANNKYINQGVHFELKVTKCMTSEIIVTYGDPSCVSEYLEKRKSL